MRLFFPATCLVCVALCAPLHASILGVLHLEPKTVQIFETYVAQFQKNVAASFEQSGRMWIDGGGPCCKPNGPYAAGKPVVEAWENTDIEGRSIHHFSGAIHIPGGAIADVRHIMQDYPNYPKYFKPDVAKASATINPDSTATDEHFAQLERLARHRKVLAWGEMGLDYYYNHSPREVQQQVFRRQLGLARAAKQPIVIHCRDAWDDCLQILEQDWGPGGLGGIFHCFTATAPEAHRGLDMGFLVSFAGNVTYPKMQHLRDVAREIPLENLLIETDSPFLPPQGRRGKRNEPAFVVEVAQALANVRNLAPEEVAATTAANFQRFFRLDDREAGPEKR